MNLGQTRAAMSAFCLLQPVGGVPGCLAAELASRWEARCESGRHDRRGNRRRREAGAGSTYELVFVDRLLLTLIHLRTGLTHAERGVIHRAGSSTIGRAIGEIRPLLAERGFAGPERPGPRLRTLEDVFACAEAENVTLRMDRDGGPGPPSESPHPTAQWVGARAERSSGTVRLFHGVGSLTRYRNVHRHDVAMMSSAKTRVASPGMVGGWPWAP